MTYKDYQEKVKNVTSENFTAILTDIMKDLQSDFCTFENAQQTIRDKDEKIRELQDTNLKLFLSTSGIPQEKEEEVTEPLTPEQELEQLIKTIKEG